MRAAPENTAASPRARWGIEGLSLGISLGGAATPAAWRQSLAWVDLAEREGLHSVWLPEMHFGPGVTASPLLCLAAFARRTERLRLATTSLLLPIHHPLQIAGDVAGLDHLSNGRVLVGFGRGFRAPLFAAFGLDPATKRDRFDRSLDLILDTWRGRQVSLDDTPFAPVPSALRGAPTRPLQSPHPPIAVAAFGRKGLEQAARRALPYLASPVEPFELIRENLAFHEDAMPAGTDTSDPVVPILRTVFVSEDDRANACVMAALAAEQRIPRSGGQLPSALARAVDAPIEDRVIVGGANEVTDLLGRYREGLGLNLLIVRPQVSGVSHALLEESVLRLQQEIVPRLC